MERGRERETERGNEQGRSDGDEQGRSEGRRKGNFKGCILRRTLSEILINELAIADSSGSDTW